MAERAPQSNVSGGNVQVVAVEYLEGEAEVYDIEVEADSCFIVAGCVVHNSAICQSLDGSVYKLDEGPRPPIHPGCRSTTTAKLDKRFEALEGGATRRARSPDGDVGYVDADLTYYGWLKKQPAAFQNSVIGPTRGKLLREGGLSSERFAELQLHKSFEPATLAEIKRLEPTAFERAGID